MKNENINNYFERVKKNPPLQKAEKVHQIISNPNAKARLKGKNNKPFKIIIMTTLFAVILSAVLFWPNTEPQTPSATIENSFTQAELIEVANRSELEVLAIAGIAPSKNIEAKVPEPKMSANSTIAAEEENISEVILSEIQQFDPDTIKTIKGDLRQIYADKELLKKLGFQFIGESVCYQNISKGIWPISYNYIKTKSYFLTKSLSGNIDKDTIPVTHNNFYPVFVSYTTGTIKGNCSLRDDSEFELVNDTLVPIFIPSGMIRSDPNDLILWFTVTDDLIDNLPQNHKEFAMQVKEDIKIKREYPKLNLIDYVPSNLIDESSFIELSNLELYELGFADTTNSRNQKALKLEGSSNNHKVFFAVGLNFSISSTPDNAADDNKHIKLVLISTEKGDILKNFINDRTIGDNQFIPLIVRKDSFPDILPHNIIYWLSPNKTLFKKLPKELSSNLQAEYNYIIAPNKSELVKPQCVVFDECKNTLEVNNFKVFPNPANNQATVTFSLPKSIDGRISVVDLSGRECFILHAQSILSKGDHRFDLSLQNVNEGIYLITLYSSSGVQVQRLIVSK